MRIAIVEDREDDTDQLRNLLKRYFPDTVQIFTFTGGIEFLTSFEKHPHDVIFLDIHMPGMNGMEVAKSIRKIDQTAYIIFVTYTQEYAIAGYSVNAHRYLVKPVVYEDLADALDQITARKVRLEHLFIFSNNTVNYRIPADQVIFIEKVDKKTEFHLLDGKTVSSKWLIRDIIKQAEGVDYLISPYQSFIINLHEVRAVHKAKQSIQMSDGTMIPIARGRLEEVMDIYLDFIGGKR
jgi:DNA-binding LytR/AlgR family response regulator